MASLSARRAWIEINWFLRGNNLLHVALRKESVDRNHCGPCITAHIAVALRKESVDRNNG